MKGKQQDIQSIIKSKETSFKALLLYGPNSFVIENLYKELSKSLIDEEKEIAKLSEKINEDPEFPSQFTELESFSKKIFPEISKKVEEFIGFTVKSDLKIEFPELKQFKLLKGKKVFATKQSRSFVDELFSAVADLDTKNIAELIQKDTEKFLKIS